MDNQIDSSQRGPVPIVALDFPSAEEALVLIGRIPRADFFKVGLQLFTNAGPDFVRLLKSRGHRVFLDLKFHDIPNTVAGAVRSAASLGVDLLTVHAVGGDRMLRAAADAAASSATTPEILAVTVLTSLAPPELETVWGRSDIDAAAEAARLAVIANDSGIAGVVASVHEVRAIRAATRPDLVVLTPGIRLAGDVSGDQSRIATPGDAALAASSYVVIGRAVTSAAVPEEAYDRVLLELAGSRGETLV